MTKTKTKNPDTKTSEKPRKKRVDPRSGGPSVPNLLNVAPESFDVAVAALKAATPTRLKAEIRRLQRDHNRKIDTIKKGENAYTKGIREGYQRAYDKFDPILSRATKLREDHGRVVLVSQGPEILVQDPFSGQVLGRARVEARLWAREDSVLPDLCDSTRHMFSRELSGESEISDRRHWEQGVAEHDDRMAGIRACQARARSKYRGKKTTPSTTSTEAVEAEYTTGAAA